MNKPTLLALKIAVWLACLIPLARLAYGAFTPTGLGADPTAHIELTTGYTTLMLIAIGLGITPLRRLSPRLSWMIKFRRLLGLFAFFYATVHMLTYVALYAGFNLTAITDDIAKRRFITMGVLAFLLLLPLALTSTNWAIRKLGGKRWNKLHKLVYIAAVAALIHYWWQVKSGVLTPLPFTIAIGILLLARPVQNWLQRRKTAASISGKRLVER